MFRNILVGIGIAGILVVSGGLLAQPVAAQTGGDLQSQIRDLMAKIADLTKQLNILQAQNTTTVSVDPAMPQKQRVCSLLYRNLSQGQQGDDVVSLQEFLRANGYLSASATGYFGPATAQAVAKWQVGQGLPNVGSFGPVSRERLKNWCAGGIMVEQRGSFSATPTRGEAPLAVDFTYHGIEENVQYYIEFGDGEGQVMETRQIYCIRAPCISPAVASHTYTSRGSYTATVSRYIACLYSNPRCMIAQPAPLSSITIVVGGGNSSDPASDPTCKSWYDGCNSCSRQNPGGPAMCTLKYCSPESMQKPYCTSHFDGTNTDNKPPVISGLSGPVQLTLNETGTWSVQASDPENGTLTYSINWGDEWYGQDMAAAMSPPTPLVEQKSTFTHSYANAGNYTVTVVVRDQKGAEAKASATVQVERTLAGCTKEYAPVCGRPSGCANTCPAGMYCTMVCRLHDPVTYGNRCMMNAANATFLHEGACTSSSGSIY